MALNIVVPLAGRGSRFIDKGYRLPKPLIEIHGVPMIQLVINNIKCKEKHRFIFLCLKEHVLQYNIDQKLRQWAPHCHIVEVDEVTQGAACTVLLAKTLINNDDALMIANSDQWVDLSIDGYLNKLKQEHLDGLIMTMNADDPKWSYVRLNQAGQVVEVVEKRVVSHEATVGIYNFRRGCDFVKAAEQMIHKNIRTSNEFYVAPVYNELINEGKKIGIYNIGQDRQRMFGLGTPEDLAFFLQSPLTCKATGF